jgi:RNA polymerase sigma-70 factor (ECF subfamily)
VDELELCAMRAADGDRGALAQLIHRTQPQVWRLCAHLGGYDHADDLVQETYLRAIGSLRTFRGDAPVRAWLLSIARRTVADDIRRRSRRRRLHRELAALPPSTAAAPSAPVDLLLGALDVDQREAFVLTQLMGLRYDEAAVICDCAIGTIRSRVARARARLAQQMDEDERAASS